MPRRCDICQSPLRPEIDKLLMQSVAFSRIASTFTEFSERQARLHFHNHVKPFVVTANELAQQSIVDQSYQFRKEVSMPLIEQTRDIRHKLWDDYYSASTIQERAIVSRELRGWVEQQAKLLGAYQQDRKNESDLKKEFTDRYSLPPGQIEELESRFEQ